MADIALTARIVEELDDHAFVIVRAGGARDSSGRTKPRTLRIGPHHNPSEREIKQSRVAGGPALQSESVRGASQDRNKGTLNRTAVVKVIAAINSGRLPLSREEREEAWNHMRQHAIELGIRMPPKRF